jgi:transposase InsO family protein
VTWSRWRLVGLSPPRGEAPAGQGVPQGALRPGVEPPPDSAFWTPWRELVPRSGQEAHRRVPRRDLSAGVTPILCPPSAANGDTPAERFVHSTKNERLDRVFIVGGGSLRYALAEYAEHYNRERPHQGIGNRLIDPEPTAPSREGVVRRRARLGGLLNFYRRAAA